MLSTQTVRARKAAPIRSMRSVRARGVSDEVKSSIEPRVKELRNTQLSSGLTSVESALPTSLPITRAGA